jgi:hypothetical protein
VFLETEAPGVAAVVVAEAEPLAVRPGALVPLVGQTRILAGVVPARVGLLTEAGGARRAGGAFGRECSPLAALPRRAATGGFLGVEATRIRREVSGAERRVERRASVVAVAIARGDEREGEQEPGRGKSIEEAR